MAIAGGIALVLALAARSTARGESGIYGRFRQQLGRVILLGLELLVAADIIRTVAVTPTLASVVVLGVIVLVRTFLSFSLEVELTGQWPWQRTSRLQNGGGMVSNGGSGERLREVVDRLQGEVAQLRRSRRRLAEAADADRRAIERAFHDGVQQHLVALAVDLRRLAGLEDDDPTAAKALLDEMAANLQEALGEATELAQRVYPPLLEARGLASALRSAAERAGVTVLIDVPRGTGYPPEITAAVYWSCVEALSSASPGSQVTVSVLAVDGALTFEIAIVGHHPEGRLNHLRDRIEALDGHISIDDTQDGGSRVQGWLPLS